MADFRRAELHPRHRFQDPRHNGKALLSPALDLRTLQHIIREQSDVRRCPHLAGQLAGQVQVLGDDVQRPTRG